MTKRLAGLTAIVTGGAGGIGSAVGLLFCEEGASVLLVDRELAGTKAVADGIREQVPDARVSHAALDLSQEAAAGEAVALAKDAFGRLDCLVNNAGIRAYEPLSQARCVNSLSLVWMLHSGGRAYSGLVGPVNRGNPPYVP